MTDTDIIIAQTKNWLSSVVIALSLCPFARCEFDAGTIDYRVIDAVDMQTQLRAVIDGCIALDNDPSIETMLLILPQSLSDFEGYLDGLSLAQALLEAQGYAGIYQLASFHPDYRFEGSSSDDAANYTNRSPYPMVHILREAGVEAAIAAHPDPQGIPARNIEFTRGLGLAAMQALLAASYR